MIWQTLIGGGAQCDTKLIGAVVPAHEAVIQQAVIQQKAGFTCDRGRHDKSGGKQCCIKLVGDLGLSQETIDKEDQQSARALLSILFTASWENARPSVSLISHCCPPSASQTLSFTSKLSDFSLNSQKIFVGNVQLITSAAYLASQAHCCITT